MSDSYIKNVIEAALLAAARPVSVAELAQIFDEASRPTPKELRTLLEQIAADYEGRGVEVRETANGFRFQVRSEFSLEVSRLWPERPRKYSRALLETLALIAYRQPITRAEIENVRGVAVNPEIVKTLMERNWVRVVGHRDVPGHPELLGTTSEFLDYFSLRSIEDLPPLAELKSLTDLNLQLPLPGTTEGGQAPAAVDGAPVDGAQVDGTQVDGTQVDGTQVDGTQGDEAASHDSDAVDSGEVAVVAVSSDEQDPGLDAAGDDDADEEELSAPGDSTAGLVAAPPSDES